MYCCFCISIILMLMIWILQSSKFLLYMGRHPEGMSELWIVQEVFEENGHFR